MTIITLLVKQLQGVINILDKKGIQAILRFKS